MADRILLEFNWLICNMEPLDFSPLPHYLYPDRITKVN